MASLNDVDGYFNRTANAVTKLAVARAVHAFDALLRLADSGYAVPGLALARTLVEETVAAWWLLTVSDADMVKRLQAHEQSYSLMLQGPSSPDVSYLPLLRGLAPMTDRDVERAKEHYDVDPNLGARHWTRRTVKQMANAVRGDMRPIERETLDALTGKPLLIANLMTHNSPLSMATRLVSEQSASVSEGFRTTRRPTTGLIHETLAIGYECLCLVAWLVSESDKTGLDHRIQEWRYEFILLDLKTRPGRNKTCPCGSGRKFKLCHGRPGMAENGAQVDRRGFQTPR